MTIEAYWNASGTIGLEHLVLAKNFNENIADGIVLRKHSDVNLRIHYHLICSNDWNPLSLTIESPGIGNHELTITSDEHGNWYDSGGHEIVHLKGCVSLDIMATPFTNTLAIYQLGLSPGESQEVSVVFIAIPDLRLERHIQRYTFLAQKGDQSCYLYENLQSGFEAQLWVDQNNLVTTYTNVWERLV